MPEPRYKDAPTTITRADDPLVDCYYCENYNRLTDDFKCKALGYFVQFAIRADLHASWSTLLHWDDPRVQLQGYPEIYSKSHELQELIRNKHVIDEMDLESIGLSLYSFPTLSHFFVAPGHQACVREATTRDMCAEVLEMREMVENSELIRLLPKASSYEEAMGALTGPMTRSQIEDATRCMPEKLAGHRLLFVDTGAPLSILKAQFLRVLNRSDKQKSSAEVMYKTWRKYGILPYIDLTEWLRWNQNLRVKLPVQSELIYELDTAEDSPFLYEKTIRETTEPNANRMFNVRSQAFRALLAAASEEFFDTIDQVQTAGNSPANEAVDEAFRRWFPRTFPCSIPDLERAARVFPQHSARLKAELDRIERSGALTLSIADRIRDYHYDAHSQGLIAFIKRIGQVQEVLSPLMDDTENEEIDFSEAIAAYERAEAAEREREESGGVAPSAFEFQG